MRRASARGRPPVLPVLCIHGTDKKRGHGRGCEGGLRGRKMLSLSLHLLAASCLWTRGTEAGCGSQRGMQESPGFLGWPPHTGCGKGHPHFRELYPTPHPTDS